MPNKVRIGWHFSSNNYAYRDVYSALKSSSSARQLVWQTDHPIHQDSFQLLQQMFPYTSCFQFTYKRRDQKFPLRSKGKPEQEVPQPMKTSHQPAQNDYQRQKCNISDTKKNSDKSEKTVGKRTDWEALGRRGKGQIGSGTVTLTQAQLNSILETVGRLALDKENSRGAAATSGKIARTARKVNCRLPRNRNQTQVLHFIIKIPLCDFAENNCVID